MSGSDLRFEFGELNFDEVAGPGYAHLAVGVEADFAVIDGSTVIMSETTFEVLLLAKELDDWLVPRRRIQFTADLGSVYEYPGAIRITETREGWVISSDLTGLRGEPRELSTVEAAVRHFITNVGQRLAAAGYDAKLSTAS